MNHPLDIPKQSRSDKLGRNATRHDLVKAQKQRLKREKKEAKRAAKRACSSL